MKTMFKCVAFFFFLIQMNSSAGTRLKFATLLMVLENVSLCPRPQRPLEVKMNSTGLHGWMDGLIGKIDLYGQNLCVKVSCYEYGQLIKLVL